MSYRCQELKEDEIFRYTVIDYLGIEDIRAAPNWLMEPPGPRIEAEGALSPFTPP